MSEYTYESDGAGGMYWMKDGRVVIHYPYIPLMILPLPVKPKLAYEEL